MDELGFRGTNNGTPSVSYTPTTPLPTLRKASSSRTSLTLPQFSILSSQRTPQTGNSSPSSSRPSRDGKRPVSPTSTPSSGSTGIPKFRTLRSMLPFGPKQTNNSSSAIISPAASSRKISNPPPHSSSTIKASDLKHRRSSSSIPTPPQNATVTRHGFMTIGPRASLSIPKEKSLPPTPMMSRSRSEDLGELQAPVISIAPPSASSSKLTLTQRGLPLPEDPFRKSSPNVTKSNAFQHGPSREDVGVMRAAGDLSTIIESELSNLSITKSPIPLDSCAEEEQRSDAGEDNESDSQLLLRIARQEDDQNTSIMHAKDMDVTAATADLSASWEAGLADFRKTLSLRVPELKNEADANSSPSVYSATPSPVSVRPSLHDTDPSPLTSVPTFSKSETQLDPIYLEQVSFDLTAFDPDLAALLSPANIPTRLEDEKEAAIVAAVDSVMPPPPMHDSASPSPEPAEPNKRTSLDVDDIWLAAASSRRNSVDSRPRTLGLQSSPARPGRSRPPSIALSSDSLPLGDRAYRASLEVTPVNSHTASHKSARLSPTPRAELTSPRSSIDDLTDISRYPMLARSYSVTSRTDTSGDPVAQHRAGVAATRLYGTPMRPSTAGAIAIGRVFSDNTRPFLRSSHTRDKDDLASGVRSPASHPRSATSLGVTSSTRRPGTMDRPATSLSSSSIGRGPPPVPHRSRKRSMSVTDTQTQARLTPDWMGPRTARAFAAAGLLDANGDPERDRLPSAPPRSESRMHVSASRVSSEREHRLSGVPSGSMGSSSTYTPARGGYLDHIRSPSGSRRRTASRTMTMSELISARGESPVTTTTSSGQTSTTNSRAAFSASTATSFSASSPHQPYQTFQVEQALATLKEKHAAEMEALLSALADSQRVSKSLREENTQLHGRVRDLEEQLADIADQLDNARRFPPQQPMPNKFTRTLLHQSRSNSGSRASPSRTRPYAHSPASSIADFDSVDATHTTVRNFLSPSFTAMNSREDITRKRTSNASSLFPIMPSNMSMLLHDEGSDSNHADRLALYQNQAYASSATSQPTSPTLNLNRLVSSSIPVERERGRHTAKLSLSSIDMSMLSSLPGSPESSLRLKPEHERHLCDMQSLDFSVMDSD